MKIDVVKEIWGDSDVLPRQVIRGYDELLHEFIRAKLPEEYLKEMLSMGKILEVGSGAGVLVNILISRGYDAYGIDLAYSRRKIMNKLKRSASLNHSQFLERLIAGDAANMPFDDCEFSFIINLFGPLCWVETIFKFDEMISEEWRVLKPEGIIYFSPILEGLTFANHISDNFNLRAFVTSKKPNIEVKEYYYTTGKLEDPYCSGGLRLPSGFALIKKLA